jgi:hypothetical protein
MGGINVGRWLAGGVVAGIVMWLVEGGASLLYMGDMETALAAHGLSMEVSPGMIASTVLVSLIAGLRRQHDVVGRLRHPTAEPLMAAA